MPYKHVCTMAIGRHPALGKIEKGHVLSDAAHKQHIAGTQHERRFVRVGTPDAQPSPPAAEDAPRGAARR
jgi:hypothetical protein